MGIICNESCTSRSCKKQDKSCSVLHRLKEPYKGLFVGSPIILGIIVGVLTINTTLLGSFLFLGFATPITPLPPAINVMVPSFAGAIGCAITGMLAGVN